MSSSSYYTWKELVPPVKDPAIVAFQRSNNAINPTSVEGGSSRTFKNNNNSAQFPTIREIGVIEKLLHSYGFIQCCYRQGRLFFHFSEVIGNHESLQIGDLVEFQQSNDRRTGKPIASTVTKMQNPSLGSEVISEKPVVGVVLTEAKAAMTVMSEDSQSSLQGSVRGNENMGQIAYEQNGETFFLPFTVEDTDERDPIKAAQQVEFFISTDDRNGLIRARKIKKKDSSYDSTKYQGVICSMKENFGFIERADVVKEIFFHFTEFKDNIEDLMLGDDVEFNIQKRNNKEIAINVHQLPEGTVIFEDVGIEKMCGQVTKTLQISSDDLIQSTNEPLFGRIVYQSIGRPLEILFGERDRIGDFTLLVGDVVEFYIATDRRDKLQRATNIRLLESTFLNSCEKRERGYVITLKEYSGYICLIKTNSKILFHASELLDPNQKLSFLDEVEFTIAEDVNDSKVAIRIKILPCGTIDRHWKPERYFGIVQKKSERAAKSGTDHFEPGIIVYELSGVQLAVSYFPSAVIQGCRLPIVGDLVEFQIVDGPAKDSKVAANIKLKNAEIKRSGFVAGIKDGAMWIELIGQRDLISFKSSLINANFHLLKVGDEIEFVCSNKSIDNICLLADGTIPHEPCLPITMEGKVIRCINSSDNCHENDYSGLIQPIEKTSSSSSCGNNNTTSSNCSFTNNNLINTLNDFASNNANNASSNNRTSLKCLEVVKNGMEQSDKFPCISPLAAENKNNQQQQQNQQNSSSSAVSTGLYSFRLSSLVDRRDVPSLGEVVRFQPVKSQSLLSTSHNNDNNKHEKFQQAGMIVSMKRCLYARVESIKGQLGTLNYELADGSKLPFSFADVINGDSLVQVGDLMEFVGLMKNNKFTALGLHKVDRHQRPDRLVSRLKYEDVVPRITIIRAPKGPDGSRGFNLARHFSVPEAVQVAS